MLLLLVDLCVCSPSLGRHATSEANPVHLSDASSATALPALTTYGAVTVSLLALAAFSPGIELFVHMPHLPGWILSSLMTRPVFD